MDKKLYVIGNGFDIAHGIKSKYLDFYNWVSKKDDYFCDFIKIFFNNKDQFWGDIENELGKYKVNKILEELKKINNPIISSINKNELIGISVDATLSNHLKKLKEYFKDWVDNIDISNIDSNRYDIEKSDYYLTFNYTDTLETIYKIPDERICHIHGYRKKNDVYILGHNRKENLTENLSSLHFSDESNKFRIKEVMNQFFKNPYDNIKKNINFFDQIKESKIKEIILIGFALYEVDEPYLNKIIEILGKNSRYIFTYHNKKDKLRMHGYVKRKNLLNFEFMKSEEIERSYNSLF